MNVIQEQLNKKQTRTIKYCGTEKLVIVPQRPLPPLNTRTPVEASTSVRALKSAGKSTSSNTRSASSHTVVENRFILALCEGRGQARGVVGIAAIDIDKPTLIVCQIADVQNYANTMAKINVLGPTTIIVPSTFVECVPENRLLTAVREYFPTVTITSLPRVDFNSNRGLNQMRLLCATAYESVLLSLKHKFYAVAAAAALLYYIEQVQHVVYCTHSIRVELQEPQDLTIIDIDTADRLELVMSRASNGNSVLSVLDHCVTSGGKRMLRATVLQPPCKQQIIESRFDCVSELLEDKEFLSRLRAALITLAEVEQCVTLGSIMSHTITTAGITERQLNYILLLRSNLIAADTLHDVLASAKHPDLRSIHSRLVETPREIILKLIGKIINDDAHPARGHSGDMQRCFAIRAGFNGLLDVARKTYTEIIDDMRSYIDRLAEQNSLPLRLAYNSKRGFHIAMKVMKSQIHTNLPPQFVQVDRGQTSITMTTSDLVNYGLQLRAVSQEIMALSKSFMDELLSNIRPHVARLYQLCDDVALLDILQSLAVASAIPGLVRPRFNAFMCLKAARHPLLERTCPDGLVANTALAQPKRNCHVITGPNMSGKSIYVRQLVLTQIMAQIGCFLPAESITLRLCDRIYAVVGREDCIESGASSFVKEMREIRYLLDTLTDNSLVVIDELCRATSCDEGVSIARAICEKLARSKAFTFITTHYLSLTTLADEYANITNWHMETLERKSNTGDRTRLIFTYNLLRGVTPVRQYGVKLARVCGSTNFVAERAVQLLNVLMPSIYDHLMKRFTPRIDFLRHELEADLELLELENELTPEMYKKLLGAFEEKTGQLYQPIKPASAVSKDTSSIISNEIKRAIHQEDSTSNLETVVVCRNTTSDSTSEMDVEASYLESCDPLGNILKCHSKKDAVSSEWSLPHINPESKTSTNSHELSFPENSSLPMRIVATTYSIDNSESSQEPHALDTPIQLFENDLYLKESKSSNVNSKIRTQAVASSSQHSSVMVSFEKNACYNEDSKISRTRLDFVSDVICENSKLNINDEEISLSRKFSLSNIVTKSTNSSKNSCTNNSKVTSSIECSVPFNNSRTSSFKTSATTNENNVGLENSVFLRLEGTTFDEISEKIDSNVSSNMQTITNDCTPNNNLSSSTMKVQFQSNVSYFDNCKHAENKQENKIGLFNNSISDIEDYNDFFTVITNAKLKPELVYRTSTPVPSSFSENASDLGENIPVYSTSPRTKHNSLNSFETVSSVEYNITGTNSDTSTSFADKSDEEMRNLIGNINNVNVRDIESQIKNSYEMHNSIGEAINKSENSMALEQTKNSNNVSKLNSSEFNNVQPQSKTTENKDNHYFTNETNNISETCTPNITPVLLFEKNDNTFSTLNSTLKQSFALDDYVSNTYATCNNDNKNTNKSVTNSNKTKRKLNNRKVEDNYGVKRAKLVRRFTKHPAGLEKIAVARRGKDGNFKVKLSSNDSLDEIIRKYTSAENK